MDFSKYETTQATDPTTLSRPIVQKESERLSIGALIATGVVGMGILASGISAVPGVIRQAQIENVVSARLQRDGITELSEGQSKSLLKTALPMVDRNTGELVLLTWETIIHNNSIPAGVYFGQNSIVQKGSNGVGNGTSSDSLVRSHGVGNIPPELAIKRLNEVKLEIQRNKGEV